MMLETGAYEQQCELHAGIFHVLLVIKYVFLGESCDFAKVIHSENHEFLL